MPAAEPGLHPGGNKEPHKYWEQEAPVFKMWLEGCPWQERGEKGAVGSRLAFQASV